jgi:Nuclease subunit of the excinuclease complex
MIGTYVMFDAFERPIYIGSSRDVDRRIKQHHKKPYFHYVTRIEVREYASVDLATKAEEALLKQYSPEFNIAHVNLSHRSFHQIEGFLLRTRHQVHSPLSTVLRFKDLSTGATRKTFLAYATGDDLAEACEAAWELGREESSLVASARRAVLAHGTLSEAVNQLQSEVAE